MDHPVVSERAEAGVSAAGPAPKAPSIRVALVYDMDACRGPTGVTRHALAQLERLARRPEVGLTRGLGAGDRAGGAGLLGRRWATCRGRELPVRTRDALRWWRMAPWPPLELWSGEVDWVYCPGRI